MPTLTAKIDKKYPVDEGVLAKDNADSLFVRINEKYPVEEESSQKIDNSLSLFERIDEKYPIGQETKPGKIIPEKTETIEAEEPPQTIWQKVISIAKKPISFIQERYRKTEEEAAVTRGQLKNLPKNIVESAKNISEIVGEETQKRIQYLKERPDFPSPTYASNIPKQLTSLLRPKDVERFGLPGSKRRLEAEAQAATIPLLPDEEYAVKRFLKSFGVPVASEKALAEEKEKYNIQVNDLPLRATGKVNQILTNSLLAQTLGVPNLVKGAMTWGGAQASDEVARLITGDEKLSWKQPARITKEAIFGTAWNLALGIQSVPTRILTAGLTRGTWSGLDKAVQEGEINHEAIKHGLYGIGLGVTVAGMQALATDYSGWRYKTQLKESVGADYQPYTEAKGVTQDTQAIRAFNKARGLGDIAAAQEAANQITRESTRNELLKLIQVDKAQEILATDPNIKPVATAIVMKQIPIDVHNYPLIGQEEYMKALVIDFNTTDASLGDAATRAFNRIEQTIAPIPTDPSNEDLAIAMQGQEPLKNQVGGVVPEQLDIAMREVKGKLAQSWDKFRQEWQRNYKIPDDEVAKLFEIDIAPFTSVEKAIEQVSASIPNITKDLPENISDEIWSTIDKAIQHGGKNPNIFKVMTLELAEKHNLPMEQLKDISTKTRAFLDFINEGNVDRGFYKQGYFEGLINENTNRIDLIKTELDQLNYDILQGKGLTKGQQTILEQVNSLNKKTIDIGEELTKKQIALAKAEKILGTGHIDNITYEIIKGKATPADRKRLLSEIRTLKKQLPNLENQITKAEDRIMSLEDKYDIKQNSKKVKLLQTIKDIEKQNRWFGQKTYLPNIIASDYLQSYFDTHDIRGVSIKKMERFSAKYARLGRKFTIDKELDALGIPYEKDLRLRLINYATYAFQRWQIHDYIEELKANNIFIKPDFAVAGNPMFVEPYKQVRGLSNLLNDQKYYLEVDEQGYPIMPPGTSHTQLKWEYEETPIPKTLDELDGRKAYGGKFYKRKEPYIKVNYRVNKYLNNGLLETLPTPDDRGVLAKTIDTLNYTNKNLVFLFSPTLVLNDTMQILKHQPGAIPHLHKKFSAGYNDYANKTEIFKQFRAAGLFGKMHMEEHDMKILMDDYLSNLDIKSPFKKALADLKKAGTDPVKLAKQLFRTQKKAVWSAHNITKLTMAKDMMERYGYSVPEAVRRTNLNFGGSSFYTKAASKKIHRIFITPEFGTDMIRRFNNTLRGVATGEVFTNQEREYVMATTLFHTAVAIAAAAGIGVKGYKLTHQMRLEKETIHGPLDRPVKYVKTLPSGGAFEERILERVGKGRWGFTKNLYYRLNHLWKFTTEIAALLYGGDAVNFDGTVRVHKNAPGPVMAKEIAQFYVETFLAPYEDFTRINSQEYLNWYEKGTSYLLKMPQYITDKYRTEDIFDNFVDYMQGDMPLEANLKNLDYKDSIINEFLKKLSYYPKEKISADEYENIAMALKGFTTTDEYERWVTDYVQPYILKKYATVSPREKDRIYEEASEKSKELIDEYNLLPKLKALREGREDKSLEEIKQIIHDAEAKLKITK